MHKSAYRLDLKSMSSDHCSVDFRLDGVFFSDPEMTEIEDGDVSVQVRIRKSAGLFDITFDLEGDISTLCDRCLESLELSIQTSYHLVVKFGSEYLEENEELLVVPETDGTLDLRWLLYEYVILSLPMQRLHIDGECNPETMEAYRSHMAVDVELVEDEASDEHQSKEVVDPRWKALEGLKHTDNND